MVVTVLRQLFSKKADKFGFTWREALGSDMVWMIAFILYLTLG